MKVEIDLDDLNISTQLKEYILGAPNPSKSLAWVFNMAIHVPEKGKFLIDGDEDLHLMESPEDYCDECSTQTWRDRPGLL